MRRIWRSRARRAAGEDGFTLVEVMVAMTVLAIAIAGLAQLAGAQMVLAARLHQRQAANGVVNQLLEKLHSASYAAIELDPTVGSPPATYTSGGATYPVIVGSTGCASSNACFDYTSTASSGGFSFNLTQVIVGVGGSAPNYNYKRDYISVTSSSGPNFTYSTTTDITGATTNNPDSVNSLTIDLQAVTSAGAQLTDPNSANTNVSPPDPFTVSITGASSDSGNTADGAFYETALAAGSYTCTVSNTATSLDWLTYPGLTSTDTFSCTDPSTKTSQWEPVICNSTGVTGSSTNGTLQVTVLTPSGSGANGAKVTLTKPTGSLQSKAPPGGTNTNTSGVVTFSAKVPPGPWNVAVASSGGPPAPGTNALNGASTCVWPGQTSYLNLAVTTAHDQTGTISIPVENTAPGGTSTMELKAVGGSYTLQTQMDVDAGTTVTMSLPVEGGTTYTGTYAVTLYCTGVGGSSTGTDGKQLGTWTSGTIASNGTWTPSGLTTSNPATGEC